MIIYKATNLVNGKVYIGLTTKTLEHRKSIHIRDCKRGLNDCYFYRAIRKYGEQNFEWEVVDNTATTMEELCSLEKYYISYYGTFDNKNAGYNSTSGGDHNYELTKYERDRRSDRVKGDKNPMYGIPSPNTGTKFTNEHKRKISEALTGSYREHVIGSNNPSAKKVVNIDTGEVFGTLSEASAKYGVSRQAIGKVCNGHRKTSGGYKWRFLV